MEEDEVPEDEIPEFEIGTVVTVDRYNHIDNVDVAEIKGYSTFGLGSNRITYKFVIDGCEIQTTGKSIMESKFYEPVADEDRHDKRWKK